MEVVSLGAASQLTQQIYSSSVRLLVSSTQQQQQQLIAFCTIVTVALSVLLLSLNKTHSIPLYPTVTHCLRCLTYVRHVGVPPRTIITRLKYLKLKRLRTFASSTSYYTSYLLRPLNKMRKETKIRVKNIINIKSGMASSYGPWSRRSGLSQSSASSASLYCPACEVDPTVAKIPASQSYPVFTSSRLLADSEQPQIHNSKIRLYRKLPLRSMSRAWGEINSIELPTWCRKPCFYFYSWMFSCNLDEIDIDDLTQYKNLSEFFRRALKPDARVIHPASLVSPCDGKILHFGRVENGMLEQVKGVNYSLRAFLGEPKWPRSASKSRSSSPVYTLSSSDDESTKSLSDSDMNNEAFERSILYNPDENCLYHCVIYLAPGDYHRFHSPADWTVFARRHFPGELFSVNPSVARWLQGLFNFNERVVYYGEWEHGFFSMTPVGATNVGSIRVYMDNGLTTNTKSKNLEASDLEKTFFKFDPSSGTLGGVDLKKGQNFGEFNLGSTIVLIFEAPKDFKFKVNQNEKVFFGCQLGTSAAGVEQTQL